MRSLYVTWAILVTFLAQGVHSLVRRPGRFEDLPLDERCDAILRVWDEAPSSDGISLAYRGSLAMLCLAVLHHLITSLQERTALQALAIDPGTSAGVQVGATLVAIYLACIAYLKVLAAHRSNQALGLTQSFVARTLQVWQQRLGKLFQDRNRRDPRMPCEGLKALLTSTENGPDGLPWETIRWIEVLVDDQLVMVESPRLDARQQCRYLAVDLLYNPRPEFEAVEVTTFPYDRISSVEFVAEPGEDPGYSAISRGYLVITLIGGETRRFAVDRESTSIVVECIRDRASRIARLGRTAPVPLAPRIRPVVGEHESCEARAGCVHCAEAGTTRVA